jgi:hypothetical protein
VRYSTLPFRFIEFRDLWSENIAPYSYVLACRRKNRKFSGYLHFELKAGVQWSFIFEQMEKNKKQLAIQDYAVNQTSLEQVRMDGILLSQDSTATEWMITDVML